jgi:hypothetical protein
VSIAEAPGLPLDAPHNGPVPEHLGQPEPLRLPPLTNLDSLRALPLLRVPGTGREPELNERQLDARRRVHAALKALGGLSSPAGSCIWHVVGLQRSVREWATRQGWGGQRVDQKEAKGILVAALGMLASHYGYH